MKKMILVIISLFLIPTISYSLTLGELIGIKANKTIKAQKTQDKEEVKEPSEAKKACLKELQGPYWWSYQNEKNEHQYADGFFNPNHPHIMSALNNMYAKKRICQSME